MSLGPPSPPILLTGSLPCPGRGPRTGPVTAPYCCSTPWHTGIPPLTAPCPLPLFPVQTGAGGGQPGLLHGPGAVQRPGGAAGTAGLRRGPAGLLPRHRRLPRPRTSPFPPFFTPKRVPLGTDTPITSPHPQVIDRSGARFGEYEDVSKVEKYQIADSDYDKRPGDAAVPAGHLSRPGDVPSVRVALRWQLRSPQGTSPPLCPPWWHLTASPRSPSCPPWWHCPCPHCVIVPPVEVAVSCPLW